MFMQYDTSRPLPKTVRCALSYGMLRKVLHIGIRSSVTVQAQERRMFESTKNFVHLNELEASWLLQQQNFKSSYFSNFEAL